MSSSNAIRLIFSEFLLRYFHAMTVTAQDGTRLYIFESIFKKINYQKVAESAMFYRVHSTRLHETNYKIKSNLKIPSLKTPK